MFTQKDVEMDAADLRFPKDDSSLLLIEPTSIDFMYAMETKALKSTLDFVDTETD